MSRQKSDNPEAIMAVPAETLDEQAVADYLRQHTNFFENKSALLTDLRIPHDAGGAVSLVERQIATLRDNNQRQQKQLDSLIEIARENDRLNERLHRLMLGVMACSDLAELLDLVARGLRDDFAADLVSIRILSTPQQQDISARAEFVEDQEAFRELFGTVLTSGKPYCGRLKIAQLVALFGEHADEVGSSALLPLGKRGAAGLLAICSYNESRFHTGADTAFLTRMGEVISSALISQLAKVD